MSQEQIGERYRILASVRTTPIYRELLALDLRERREVTLWVIEPQLAPDPATQKRFMVAAQKCQKAKVPGTMQVVGGGVARGMTYLVIAPNGADCLRVRLLRWRPGTREIASIVGQLATSVSAAHERGLFHGLLTARDVLFVNDRVLLSGAGLWSALARRPLLAALRHEASGLAPEARADRDKLGPRADVYAVAAIAAEMLHVSTGASLTELRQNGWNPLLVEALDRALAHGTNARPSSLVGLQTALTVRADAPRRVPVSEALTAVELHESQEATVLRDAFRPSLRLPDGRSTAPPPAPALRKSSQPPPLPRAITARRGAGAATARPRLLRRATTYSGNR
jgi:hypothetical protein